MITTVDRKTEPQCRLERFLLHLCADAPEVTAVQLEQVNVDFEAPLLDDRLSLPPFGEQVCHQRAHQCSADAARKCEERIEVHSGS